MLMAGSTARLFANIVFSLLCCAFFLWGFFEASKLGGLLGLAFSSHSLILAVRMIDLPTPVVSAGPNGMVCSKIITDRDLLDWASVRRLDASDIHFHLLWMPWLSYLAIRTDRRDYFNGWSRLLPSTWFGLYFLPARLLRGGGKAVRQFVNTIENLREADRHDAAFGPDRDFMSESSLRWNMLRNVEFPVAKDGPTQEALIGAVRDSLMEQAGVHRDLLPEENRLSILASESGKSLAAKGEEWGRQLVAEMHAKEPNSPPLANPGKFGRKGVPMLNGKPLD